MNLLRQLVSNNDLVSSNRSITVLTFIFMLIIMTMSLVFSVNVEILKVVLEYSFYIYVASISLKSVEKVTSYFRTNDKENKTMN